MKIKKILLSLFLFSVVSFGFYLYKLHALAVEGNGIFEYRCTNVNPHLIRYKNSFLKFADCIKMDDVCSNEEVTEAFGGYISGMEDYIPEETKWLEMQKKYMDQWDFKLIEPWYIKQGGEYQWKMYEGYRDDAKALVGTWKQGEASEESSTIQSEAKERRIYYEQKYYDFFDQAAEINDWRKIFGNLPVPEGCTEENLTIPNTSGALDKKPTPFPVDPETAS